MVRTRADIAMVAPARGAHARRPGRESAAGRPRVGDSDDLARPVLAQHGSARRQGGAGRDHVVDEHGPSRGRALVGEPDRARDAAQSLRAVAADLGRAWAGALEAVVDREAGARADRGRESLRLVVAALAWARGMERARHELDGRPEPAWGSVRDD